MRSYSLALTDVLKTKITNIFLDTNADVARAEASLDGCVREDTLTGFKTKIIALINIASFNKGFSDAIKPEYQNYLQHADTGRINGERDLRRRILMATMFWGEVSNLLREFWLIVIDGER